MKLSWIPDNANELGATMMVEAREWEGSVEEKLLKQGEMKPCGAKWNFSRVYAKGGIWNGKVFSTADAPPRVRSRLSVVRHLLINTSFTAPHIPAGENVSSATKMLESLFA